MNLWNGNDLYLVVGYFAEIVPAHSLYHLIPLYPISKSTPSSHPIHNPPYKSRPKIPSLLLHIRKLIISGAGSDTTAISLRAMLYYMCKNPSTMRKLQKEIQEMEQKGLISDPVTYQQSCKMPYLQAVMKEAMRLVPAAWACRFCALIFCLRVLLFGIGGLGFVSWWFSCGNFSVVFRDGI